MITVPTVDIVFAAETFVRKKFAGMKRPNKSQPPMFYHMREVAGLVLESGGSDEEIAAAWLHDTIEDTSTTLADIEREFGLTVAKFVDGLTDTPEMTALMGVDTIKRKVMQAERVKGESESIRRIKLADQISNIRSVAYDPPVKWDRRKTRDYIRSALLIALECKGVSVLLDDYFVEAYQQAMSVHC